MKVTTSLFFLGRAQRFHQIPQILNGVKNHRLRGVPSPWKSKPLRTLSALLIPLHGDRGPAVNRAVKDDWL